MILEAAFVTGAHVDLTARLLGATRFGYSNPGSIAIVAGGGGLNSASAAAALGLRSSLASPIGADAHGALLRKVLAERGIGDGLAEMEGFATGLYTAVVAADGELVLGVADLAIYEQLDAGWLLERCGPVMRRADCWVVNANLPENVLQELAAGSGGRRLACCTISPEKAPRLRPVLARTDILFANLAEARALTGMLEAEAGEIARALAAAGAKAGTISQGPGPVAWWQDGVFGEIPSPPAALVIDVVGAGDALAGTVLAALAREMAMPAAVRVAIAAAQLTITTPEPFHSGLSWERLHAGSPAVPGK